jgi:hypothetical protein
MHLTAQQTKEVPSIYSSEPLTAVRKMRRFVFNKNRCQTLSHVSRRRTQDCSDREFKISENQR